MKRSWAEILAGLVVLVVAGGFLYYAVTTSGRAATAGGLTLTAKFDRVDGINVGSDVRIGGVRVGSVSGARLDPQSFLAVLTLNLDAALRIPEDSSAEITSEGLLGGRYVALVPGGADRVLRSGQEITITQSAVSLEALLGRFIFSVTELAGQNQPRPAEAPSAPR
jgi:phospholipid/cholesterol/gamma-HCH transport system substrate-binding protein